MQKVFNADILMENPDNFVRDEHITNIIPNNPYYVIHSIYFAHSLTVFEDAARKKRLVLNVDYEYASIDSVASELSNKDCYRAIIFLKTVSQAYIDYHSYGDLVSADMLNRISENTEQAKEQSDILSKKVTDLTNELAAHQKNTAPHGAQESVYPKALALRSEAGTLKAADATDEQELTTLGQINKTITATKNDLQTRIQKAKEEALDELDKRITDIKKTLYDKNPALTIMPLNPVCHYDMADVQYIDVTQNNLKNFSYTFSEGSSYSNYSATAINALKNGHRYRITADFECLQGKAQYATMYYYDFGRVWKFGGGPLYKSQTPVINGKCRCILDFVCKKTELSGHRLEVLFYNGQAGHISSKDISRWSNFRIETISDSIAIDVSGNENHATIVGDVEKATDNAVGTAIAFNNGFLTRPPQDFIGVGKQWSHSRWIKINPSEQDKTHNPRIWRYGSYDYSFFNIRENNGQIGNVILYCYRNDKNSLWCSFPKEALIDNKWHHLVVMTDLQPSYCRKIVYLDRQKIFDKKETGDFSDWADNQAHFDMGNGSDPSNTKGRLANLIFFDRFLTEAEIQWLYHNPIYLIQSHTVMEKKFNESLIKIFQNGYIQWPGMPKPEMVFSFKGYRWAEVNYDGCFFWAKGKEAKSFYGDEQGDAIRDIIGAFPSGLETHREDQADYIKAHTYGCFYPAVKDGSDLWAIADVNVDTEVLIRFDASQIVPTANENRPRNRTIIIWRLERI